MLGDYLPIVVLTGIAAIFAVASLALSAAFRPRKPSPAIGSRTPAEPRSAAARSC